MLAKESAAFGGINGFDTAKMSIEGLQSGDLNKFLHTVSGFEGAYGRYGASGANDFDIPATIKQITKSGFEFSTPKPTN